MTAVFTAYDLSGEPLPGLTPGTWITYLDAGTGEPVEPPEVIELGGGQYRIDSEDSHTGILDLGPTCLIRYVLVLPETHFVFTVWDLNGAPMTGASPTWIRHVDPESGDPVEEPDIEPLGDYLHVLPHSSSPRTVGLIDLGEGANPRILDFDSKPPGSVPGIPPIVEVLSPEPGSVISRQTKIKIRVTDLVGLRRVILHAEFAGRRGKEVVHDGDGFSDLYLGSTRSMTVDGWEYSLTRDGGWPGSPRIRAIAINLQGIETA